MFMFLEYSPSQKYLNFINEQLTKSDFYVSLFKRVFIGFELQRCFSWWVVVMLRPSSCTLCGKVHVTDTFLYL